MWLPWWEHHQKVENLYRVSLLSPKTKEKSQKEERVPCVTLNMTSSRYIKKMIRKHWHKLKKGHLTLFSTPPLMAYPRSPNLKDKLVRANVGQGWVTRQQTITGNRNPGTFSWLGCAHYHSLKKRPSILTLTRKFIIPDHFNNNSDYVVYLIKCPCSLGYMGE